MIRLATLEDVPSLVELGQLLHDTSSYSTLGYDADKVARQVEGLINGAGGVFVADRDEKVIGFIGGALTEHWFSGDKVAFDYSFFVHPDYRHGVIAVKLIKAFEMWAVNNGARQIRMGITTAINIKGTSRLFKAMGFDEAGALFSKEVGYGN